MFDQRTTVVNSCAIFFPVGFYILIICSNWHFHCSNLCECKVQATKICINWSSYISQTFSSIFWKKILTFGQNDLKQNTISFHLVKEKYLQIFVYPMKRTYSFVFANFHIIIHICSRKKEKDCHRGESKLSQNWRRRKS